MKPEHDYNLKQMEMDNSNEVIAGYLFGWSN